MKTLAISMAAGGLALALACDGPPSDAPSGDTEPTGATTSADGSAGSGGPMPTSGAAMDDAPDGSAAADPSDSGPSDSGPSDDAADTTQGQRDSGPIILELSSNITMLYPDSIVRLTAIVTDPDGIEDVIGGSLTNASGSVTFGALATQSQEGAYTIELSWSEINLADPISFVGSEVRPFVATFFDTSGHETSQSIPLTFACPFEDGACGGTCRGLNSVDACGTCDTQCAPFDDCQQGACVQDFACHPLGLAPVCPSGTCHMTPLDYACTTDGGTGVQGDACAGPDCASGFACLSAGGGGAQCLGVCLLADPQCTAGTTCMAVMGVPMWEGTGLCL